VRIAQQIAHAFGVDIDKDVVRRVLAKHYRPGDSGSNGPSWLTFIGHMKDSLWSVDLFRCESILLRSHWVMLVMDVFTRRIVGFGIERASIDGMSACRMFNDAVGGRPLPKRVGTDHDPLFRFHRWIANLRVLEIKEIKSVPYAPVSDPFVERLIGTIRARVPGPRLLLERGRPGAKVGGIPGLLQRPSRSSRARGSHASAACRRILPRCRRA
jgi:putative transposase